MAGLRISVFVAAVSFLLGMSHSFTGAGIMSHTWREILRFAVHALDSGLVDVVEIPGNANGPAIMDVGDLLFHPVKDAAGAPLRVRRGSLLRRCDAAVESGRWEGWKLDV